MQRSRGAVLGVILQVHGLEREDLGTSFAAARPKCDERGRVVFETVPLPRAERSLLVLKLAVAALWQ